MDNIGDLVVFTWKYKQAVEFLLTEASQLHAAYPLRAMSCYKNHYHLTGTRNLNDLNLESYF